MSPNCNSKSIIRTGLIFIAVVVMFWYSKAYFRFYHRGNRSFDSGKDVKLGLNNISFEGFSNVTGADRFIVPNIIHFIRFKQEGYSFIDYVVIKAAMKNQRPDYFYIHTDVPGPGNFTGRCWNLIQNDYELWSRIRLLHLGSPNEIFGRKLNSDLQHGSDIARIRILQKYGGIYLNNDVYVIQNLDKYRKFECVIDWIKGEPALGNQVIIAHSNSCFLALWLDSPYRNYKNNSWYFNAGYNPVSKILIPQPHLIHRVNNRFNSKALPPGTAGLIYHDIHFNWRQFEAIYLLIRHRSNPKEFNEKNIKNYKYPFGQMAREVLDDYPASDVI